MKGIVFSLSTDVSNFENRHVTIQTSTFFSLFLKILSRVHKKNDPAFPTVCSLFICIVFLFSDLTSIRKKDNLKRTILSLEITSQLLTKTFDSVSFTRRIQHSLPDCLVPLSDPVNFGIVLKANLVQNPCLIDIAKSRNGFCRTLESYMECYFGFPEVVVPSL